MGKRARTLLLAAAAAALATWSLRVYVVNGGWGSTLVGERMAATMVVAAIVVPLAGGVLVMWYRPGNRCGPVMLLLGLSTSLWSASFVDSTVNFYVRHASVAFRPLLFWLVLAWPVGRLRGVDRRWLGGYTVLLSVLWLSGVVLLRDPSEFFGNPLAVAQLTRLHAALTSLGTTVVMPSGAIVLIATVVHRYRGLPTTARPLGRWVLAAGIFAAVGDLVLVAVDRFLYDVAYGSDGRTPLGGVVMILDIGRLAIVPALLVTVMLRAHRRAPATQRRVEIGPAQADAAAAVAAALGDTGARVLYHQGGGWLDANGVPAVEAPGRSMTVVSRAGVPVAAVEYRADLDDRPTAVEVAVAAAATRIEAERLAVVARNRTREARSVRRAVVELEDETRRRLERDLHDGAQQRIVGLALMASLAAREPDPDLAPLAAGVRDATNELREFAGGQLPAALMHEGLGAAIRGMASTSPVAFDVDVSLPAHLPPVATATAWFVVAEAVTNAVKHGHASHVSVHGRAEQDLVITVTDDGCGGADLGRGTGLRGLADRARATGGELQVVSPPGGGTTVRLSIAVGR